MLVLFWVNSGTHLLPIAYGVWGKVMFSHSVQGGGCIQDEPPLDAPPACTPMMHPHDAPPACIPHGCTPSSGLTPSPGPQKTDGQQAVGTHPAGMHTCFRNVWRYKHFCHIYMSCNEITKYTFIVNVHIYIASNSKRIVAITKNVNEHHS